MLNCISSSKLTDKEATLESTPAIEDVDDIPQDTLQRMAAGNNIYESVFARYPNEYQAAEDNEDSKDGKSVTPSFYLDLKMSKFHKE